MYADNHGIEQAYCEKVGMQGVYTRNWIFVVKGM